MVCLIHHVVYSCISFILISSLPLCNYTIDYLSILLYMDMWIVSSFWLLRSVLLWTFFYMCFGENMYIFLLSIYLGGELQGPKLCVCSAFVSSAKKYSLVAIAKDTTSSSVWVSQLLHALNIWNGLLTITIAMRFLWARVPPIQFEVVHWAEWRYNLCLPLFVVSVAVYI